jgi:cell division protein ZapA (FtsZ GTPase activity inhibitor)
MNVQFSVRGRTFNVRTDDDGVLIQQLAGDLDARLRKQAERASKLDDVSVGIITTLDLMHEMELERNEMRDKLEKLEQKIELLMATVEALLPTDVASDIEDK